WWLKNGLPESIAGRSGTDFIFESDSNKIRRRGNRTIEYRDYYILFYDLSQLVFEIQFESEDPRSTVKLINSYAKPIPVYHKLYGQQIVSYAAQFLGTKIQDEIVSHSLQVSGAEIISPIGNKSFGVTIYKNLNNTNVSKIDEIKPGDVLWVKNGKYVSHKGLMGAKSVTLEGPDNVYTAIIYEYDPKKEKFKVIESDSTGHVKKESFKIGEFKSGRIRVFRPVGRDYVEWD
ncbi:predicted protein, partial [Scheffersomyces stipitis CBS 6054]